MLETNHTIMRACAPALAALLCVSLAPQMSLADEADASGGVAVDISVDFVSEYWFRGLGQENEGLIVQPGLTLTFDLFETNGGSTVTAYVGNWNSYQDSTPGNEWYESDIYGGFNLALPSGDSIDLSYIYLYNPAGNGIFAEEVDLAYSFDDSQNWGGMGLSPYILLAVEVDGGSDAGADEGVYLELGVEPDVTELLGTENMGIGVTLPVTLGLSLDSYYEDGLGGDDDDTFGFLDVGLVASKSLDAFLPKGFGSWDASVGVHIIFLGDTAENISTAFGTGNDDNSVYATFGLSTSF